MKTLTLIIISFFFICCGCANQQMKDPHFQEQIITEINRQISITKTAIERQKERNEKLSQLKFAIDEEENRIRSLIEDKKARLEQMKIDSFNY